MRIGITISYAQKKALIYRGHKKEEVKVKTIIALRLESLCVCYQSRLLAFLQRVTLHAM